MLIPLNSGTYQARSYIADDQVCENLFPETNPQEAEPEAPVTHYPREGKRPLSSPPVQGLGRGIFTLSNGRLFGVVGNSLYYIDQNWQFNLLGQITALNTPVSMSDNGTTAVLVDGSPNGYTVTLANNAFAPLVDGTGTFQGSVRTDFSDTFLAFNTPGTNQWVVSLSNQVAFNALITANKDTTPDPIQTLAFNIRQAWLIGTEHSEVWWLAGSTPFPYQSWPNVFIPYGTPAPYSLVQADIDLFWLSSNQQGEVIAVQTSGYSVHAISTRALEFEWSNYPKVSDCIGGTFQQAGHTFIIFHFPTADKTWAYDLSTKQWHRRTWIDNNGIPHRERTAFYASVGEAGGYPRTIVGQDWQTGQIYALDPKYYTDNGQPIVCRRSFPHVVSELKMITPNSFVADFETGGIVGHGEGGTGVVGSPWSAGFGAGFGPLPNGSISPLIAGGDGPRLCMRVSKNGGVSYSNYRQKGLVSSGNYRKLMRWRGLGQGRDFVFELLWAYPGPSALQGAYIDPIKHGA